MDERQKKERERRGGLLSRLSPTEASGRDPYLLLGAAFLGLTAFFFAGAHVIFGAYPLALALLAVVRGYLPLAVWAGATVGALSFGRAGLPYLFAYALLLCLRLIFSKPREDAESEAPEARVCGGYFDEAPQLQITSVILSGVFLATWELLRVGLTTYALLYAAASVAVPAVCAALLVGFFASELRMSDLLGTRVYDEGEVMYAGISPLYVQVGALTFFSACAYAFSFYHIFGLSVGYCLATFFTLFVARRWGALRGCVAGMLTALSVLPAFAHIFGVLGLLAGALFSYGTGYALTLGVGGAAVCASYFGGASGLLGVVPEMCMTALLTWPLYIKMNREGAPVRAANTAGDHRAVTHAAESVMRRDEEGETHLHLLSDALLVVSDNFRREGQSEENPEIADYFALCDRVCHKICSACENKDLCWKGERTGVSAIGRIAEQLGHSGTIRLGEESFFPAYCRNEDAILRAIRADAAALCGGKRRSAHSAQIAAEYMMMSRLLSDEARKQNAEGAQNTALSAKLKEALHRENPALATAVVLVKGDKSPTVTVASRSTRVLADARDEIRRICEEEMEILFAPPLFEEVNQVATLRLQSRTRYRVEAVSATSSYREGEISGDAVAWFDSCRHDFYALLSDGMGSGRRAARASHLACVFLEQMLSAGCSAPYTSEMLHHLLRGRNDESSATIDLFSIDLMRGRAFFMKCGAVASYVKRGGSFFRIRAKTPPIGILKDYAGEVIPFDIQGGDIVVLLSDGICPEGEEAPWLLQAFNEELQGDLQRAANRILSLASQKSEIEDDKSILIFKIEDEAAAEEETFSDEKEAS